MSSTKSRIPKLLGRAATALALAMAASTWSAPATAADPASLTDATNAGLSPARVYFTNKREAGKLFVGFEGAIADTNYADGYHRMKLTPTQMAELRAAGYRVEAAVPADEPAPTSLPGAPSAAPAAAGAVAVSGIPYQTPTYACYRTVAEVFAAAQGMVAAHPTLASWIDIGDSWVKAHGGSATDPTLTGDDMMTLVLTSPVVTSPKPRLFITSSIHGDEIATLELAMRFAEYLVDRYGIDADATWILDHNEVHLLPATNPDARRLNELGGSGYRKNRNDSEWNEICTMGGYIGVDLNRNYTFKWDQCDPQITCGYDTNACGYTYIGSASGSEPETQAVMNRLGQLFTAGGRSGMFIDLHSYSELVLWPWGYTSQAPADVQALRTLGRKLASFNNYYPEASYELYGTPGSSVDYAYGVFGIPAFTIEVGKAKWQDCAYFETDILPKNVKALLYAAKVARAPYETPAGPGVTSVALGKNVVLDAAPVTLSATVDDRQLGVFGIEGAQTIAAAQYSLDQAPWVAGASPVAMAAVDGRFGCRVDDACGTQATLAESLARELVDAAFTDRLADDPCKLPGQPPVGASDPAWYVQKRQAFGQALEKLQEPVAATVPTSGLTVGRHLLYVRGRDSAGNWGPVTAAYLTKTTRGDVNASGRIDIVDALMIAQASADLDPRGFIVEAADVNCDGGVTIVDALMVAQYSANLIALPVCPAS